MMSQATVRTMFRWIHIVFGMPIIGYIYDSPKDTPYYAWTIREIFLPVLLISGLWMWKGHVVRRLISRRWPDKALQRSYSHGHARIPGMRTQ